KFSILSETTTNVIGYISTEVNVLGDEGESICLGGSYAGERYQYLYKCSRYGVWSFQKKFKNRQSGCQWGKIT
ncbi:MAG: hypothetical protein V3T30_06255, partial [Thermodesulfobacteriota bacterium]